MSLVFANRFFPSSSRVHDHIQMYIPACVDGGPLGPESGFGDYVRDYVSSDVLRYGARVTISTHVL